MLNYLSFGNLSKKVGIVSLSKLFYSLSNFIINIFLARTLTKEINGSYQQTILLINILSMIFIFGIPTSIYYFFPRLNEREKKGLFYQSILILCFLGIITGVFMFFSAGWIAEKFNNTSLKGLLKPASFYLFFLLASSYSDAILITINKHKLMAFLSLVFTILQLFCVIVPVLLKKSLESVFISLGFVTSIKFFVNFFICQYLLSSEKPIFQKSLFKLQIFYVIPLGLNSVIDVFSKYLDRTIISYLFTPSQLAEYHYGAIEIPLIGILIGSITAVLIPELSRCKFENRWEEFSNLFRNATTKTAIFLFPLFGVLFILAPALFIFLFTDTYLPGVPIFRIYLFMLPIRIVSFQAILFALGRTKIVMLGAILDLLANFTLSITLVRFLGPNGVAMGLVIATIFQALFYLYIIKDTVQFKWAKLIDFNAFFKIIIACVIACIPCAIINSFTLKPIIIIMIGGISFSIIYIISLKILFKK